MALPQGYENSNQNSTNNAPSPFVLKPMVVPTLTPNLQFPPDKMDKIEIDYGDGKNWTSTFVYPKLPVLANGEELSWHLLNTEGVFNKKALMLFAITNFRVLIYDFKNPYESGCVFLEFVDDILVMNSHRVSHSTRMGSFSSAGRYGMRVGTGVGSGTSTSHTVGDVVFMKDGEQFIVMREMVDPQGIARLAKAIKKTIRIRNSIVDIELPEDLQGSTIPKETLIELSQLFNSNITEFYKQGKKLFIKNPDAVLFNLLNASLTINKNWEEMEILSRKMIKEKNHEPAFEALCTALLSANKMQEGITELNNALKLFPDNSILQDYKQQVAPAESSFLESESIICPKCKKENEKGSKFCNTCGSEMNEGCVKCGHVNPKNAKFCNDCGFILK